jgi:hypothetical protein
MKKLVLFLVLFFCFSLVGSAPAFASPQSIALTGTIPPGGYPHSTNPAPTQVNNNIRMAAQSINLTGQLPTVQKGAGATAAIPAGSINLNGTLPSGVQGLTASNGNNGVGVAILEGLGYLFTVRLLTLHF